ncbi:MAG: Plug domain-containing protein, partial [Deltaproteobacteria bacterium]|nr:Plug domain-containing protein [Deltaproteobacteria bacterium]
MKKIKLFWILPTIVWTLLAQSGWAEDKKEDKKKDEIKLEEMVVTATRTEKSVSDAPASVNVVTKEEIETRNIQTIDQALNDTVGVFNRRSKGLMDTLAQVSLRGIPGQNRSLILIDGLALNNAYTGAPMWAGIFPENVEKVEVVKGPFSSLYGGY